MEDNKKIKELYRSKEYYRRITEIKYTPSKERTEFYLVNPKGKVEQVKLFGLIPLYKKVYEEDEYRSKENGHYYVESDFYRSYIKKNRVFYKAEVSVTSGKDYEVYRFDDDEKAKRFVESLIEECRDCGNDLI